MPSVPLHPELELYLEPFAGTVQMLRHPLVFAVPYFGDVENERLNRMLEHRKQVLRAAMDSGDHEAFVFTHERPYRLNALLELHGEIPQKALNPLILKVYVDTENARENYDEWFDLLEPLTGTDPWETVHSLPEGKFTVYRGGPVMGFSWTLDLERAKWFANRWNEDLPVWEATVTRDDVIGYYDGRNEKEVVAVYDRIKHSIQPFKE